VALVEIAVGLLAFFGLVTRAAALAGLALNLLLFLTNSWNTYPYFLGSDIVFVFAWLPFVLTGATGQPALDPVRAAQSALTPAARSTTAAVSSCAPLTGRCSTPRMEPCSRDPPRPPSRSARVV
jgi:thiosulfate dehydrogenase [quinone] large subunit